MPECITTLYIFTINFLHLSQNFNIVYHIEQESFVLIVHKNTSKKQKTFPNDFLTKTSSKSVIKGGDYTFIYVIYQVC